MAGSNKMSLARKAFKEYNGQTFGAETLKQIVRSKLTSNENNVLEYLRSMREIGMLTETRPFKFLINIDAVVDITKKDGENQEHLS